MMKTSLYTKFQQFKTRTSLMLLRGQVIVAALRLGEKHDCQCADCRVISYFLSIKIVLFAEGGIVFF